MNKHSEEIQEIICANCGRPNLPEAVKCWYCQIELASETEPTEFSDENDIPVSEAPLDPVPQNPRVSLNEAEEIPEWLRRIREKEQKERASQDARDQWQQQTLFNGGSGPARPATSHKPDDRPVQPPHSRPVSPTIEDEDIVSQPTLEPAQPEQTTEPDRAQVPAEKTPVPFENEYEVEETPSDEASEDLPEGFIKFDSNNN